MNTLKFFKIGLVWVIGCLAVIGLQALFDIKIASENFGVFVANFINTVSYAGWGAVLCHVCFKELSD